MFLFLCLPLLVIFAIALLRPFLVFPQVSWITGTPDTPEPISTHPCYITTVFAPRPVLVKSTMLAVLVEQLKKTGLQAAPAGLCSAGSEDVVCDVCTGRKLKAIKSCLSCPASYCEKHLQPHLKAAAFRKHKLVEPSKNLQENICSRHEVMMFCRTDQKCICYLCCVDEHRGHDTVSAAAERTEKQREMEESRQQIQQRIQDREKEVKLLQQEVEAINHSADQTVEDSGKIFTKMILLIQKRSCDVKQQIRAQQQTEVRRVKGLQEELEQEITELKRRDAELKQLPLTEDHSHFLLNYPSLPPLSESTSSAIINVRPLTYFEDVTTAEWTNISLTVPRVDILLSEPEPKSRADFLGYLSQITMDPNTACRHLLLSDENRKVTYMEKPQSEHPDRFTIHAQVLSRESLTGHCYWEVETRGNYVYVTVAYKNISRSGNDSVFGYNDKSWSLVCSPFSFSFYHKSIGTSISAPGSSRVGVYLDYRAGVLSFYSVSKSRTLLHRVQTTFTQPLHAGLRLYYVGSTADVLKSPQSVMIWAAMSSAGVGKLYFLQSKITVTV
uniref:B30.2/SPRY domain-containing protein n=1 Tax=Oryzias latipes TaxID=8090 RepID=A0A3P9JB21_ORYLA